MFLGIPSPVKSAGSRTAKVTRFRFTTIIALFLLLNVFPAEHLQAQSAELYQAGMAYEAGAQPRSLQLVDLDGDGDNDMVVLAETDGQVFTYKNDGVGSFTVWQTLDLPLRGQIESSEEILVEDLNQDGFPDLVAIGFDSFGGFMAVYGGEADGSLTYKTRVETHAFPIAVEAANFDDESGLELAVAFYRDGAQLSLFEVFPDLSLGAEQSLALVPSGAIDMEAADLNNDGDLDLVISFRRDNQISIFENDGFGTFSLLKQLSGVRETLDIAAVDVDNDSFLDIAVIEHYSRSFLVYHNEAGTVNSTPEVKYEAGDGTAFPRLFDAGDIDNDGDIDFAVSRANAETARVMINDGSGNFEVHSFDTDFHPWAIVLGELDGDEYPEIVIGFRPTDFVRVYHPTFGKTQVDGRVFLDLDNSCSLTDDDQNMANLMVEIQPGPRYVFADDEGFFSAYLNPGEWQFEAVSQPRWFQDCASTPASVVIDNSGETVSGVELPLTASAAIRDLHVSVVSGRARPGRELTHILTYRNVGTIPYTGSLDMTSDYSLIGAEFSLEPDDMTENQVRWLLTNVPIGFEGKIIMKQTPARTTSVGTDLCVQLAADLKNRDLLLSDSQDEYCVRVTAGYDPNDIRVWPRGEGAEGRISQDIETLSYMIRFQNTGNDTTFNVVVRDTLPATLDVRRLRFGSASHAYSVTLLANRILEFTFADIYLPDSTTNPEASQGFVKYRVDMQSDLTVGTEIRNRAGIFFDFNPVVLTNDAVTTISSGTTRVGESPQRNKLYGAPNPIDQLTTISNIPVDVNTLVLSDIQGRVLLRIKTDSQTSVSVDCSSLAPGAYLVRTEGGAEVRETQISVVR